MRKNLLLICLFFTGIMFAQKNARDQYSVEAGYGLGISGEPGISQFSHFNVGFRYMVVENWGMKFDFGADQFRTDTEGYANETGVDYKRISMQVVHNLGRTVGLRQATGSVGLLAHAGLGYSWIKPVNIEGQDPVDSMGNVIVGITPQVYILKNLALHADASYIMNFSQHRDFNGVVRYDGKPKSFTSGLANISIGLTFYFGPNAGNADWR